MARQLELSRSSKKLLEGQLSDSIWKIALVRVLGIDPSIRRTGWGVLEAANRQKNRQKNRLESRPANQSLKALAWGDIPVKPQIAQSQALHLQHQRLTEIIEQYQPDTLAIEGIVYVQNMRTAISMGSSRAIACLVAAEHGLPIYEYPPARVKQAVSGRGQAPKQQVAFMVRVLLKLDSTPSADAADALAVAITHLQAEQSVQAGTTQRRQL